MKSLRNGIALMVSSGLLFWLTINVFAGVMVFNNPDLPRRFASDWALYIAPAVEYLLVAVIVTGGLLGVIFTAGICLQLVISAVKYLLNRSWAEAVSRLVRGLLILPLICLAIGYAVYYGWESILTVAIWTFLLSLLSVSGAVGVAGIIILGDLSDSYVRCSSCDGLGPWAQEHSYDSSKETCSKCGGMIDE